MNKDSEVPAILLGEGYVWRLRYGLYDLWKGRHMVIELFGSGAEFMVSPFHPDDYVKWAYPPELGIKLPPSSYKQINSKRTRLWAETVYMTGAYK